MTDIKPKKENFFTHRPALLEVGPLERGFTSATNQEDLKGWVAGFHHHDEWSDELPVAKPQAGFHSGCGFKFVELGGSVSVSS